MGDTVIFMSAYNTVKFSKGKRLFRRKERLDKLLRKHHITCMMCQNKLIAPRGILALDMEYDYVMQRTEFEYTLVDTRHDIEDFSEQIETAGFFIKLLHSQSLMADASYFKIDYFLHPQSFIVYMDDDVLQIDPFVFSLNGTLIIVFEIIDFNTGVPLKKSDVYGKEGNYNLRIIKGFANFEDTFTTLSNSTIPKLIYHNVSDFLSAVIGKKFVADEYSYVHNTLVLSNKIESIEEYFCKLIGVKDLPV